MTFSHSAFSIYIYRGGLLPLSSFSPTCSDFSKVLIIQCLLRVPWLRFQTISQVWRMCIQSLCPLQWYVVNVLSEVKVILTLVIILLLMGLVCHPIIQPCHTIIPTPLWFQQRRNFVTEFWGACQCFSCCNDESAPGSSDSGSSTGSWDPGLSLVGGEHGSPALSDWGDNHRWNCRGTRVVSVLCTI